MIGTSIAGAGKADPRIVLADLMAIKSFDSVPVMVVDCDELKDPLSFHLRQYFNKRIADYEDCDARKLQALFNTHFVEIDKYLSESLLKHGVTVPIMSPPPMLEAHIAGPNFLMQPSAAFIFAPQRAFGPDLALAAGHDLVRRNRPSLTNGDHTAFRLYALFHELAHVATAGEPQADKMATLSCRKFMPDSPLPTIVADIRAVFAVRDATLLAGGLSENHKHAAENLRRYGWSTVQANDDAIALPQETVEAMTDRRIIDHRYECHEPERDSVLNLGGIANSQNSIFREIFFNENIMDGHIVPVAKGAIRLARTIDRLTGDPKLHAMARRFALAAKRLAMGAEAYGPNPPLSLRAYQDGPR